MSVRLRLPDAARAVHLRGDGHPPVHAEMRRRLLVLDTALAVADGRGSSFRPVERVNPKTGMDEMRHEIETDLGTIGLVYSGSERQPLQPRRMRVSGRRTTIGIAATVVLDLDDGSADPVWTMSAARACLRLCDQTLAAAEDPDRTALGERLAAETLGWGTLVTQHHAMPLSPPSLCHARAATPWLRASIRRTRELGGRADIALLNVPKHLPPPSTRGATLMIDEDGPVVMAITASILPGHDAITTMRAIAAYREQQA